MIPTTDEDQKFEVEEAKINGQKSWMTAAVKYEANGGSPIIGEELRKVTGRNRVNQERARMESQIKMNLDF